MGKNGQSVQLFKNPIWEAFSRVHPVVPFLYWSPIVIAFFWSSGPQFTESPWATALASICGLAFWTWTEYAAHRWLFHAHPRGKNRRRLLYLLHGNHHDAPNDFFRLLFPIVPSSCIALLIYGVLAFILGGVVKPFFASFLLGYLIYDYTHLLIHWHTPRSKIGKWIKTQHMEHHFVFHDSKYGVTSPLWDFLLKTHRPVGFAKK